MMFLKRNSLHEMQKKTISMKNQKTERNIFSNLGNCPLVNGFFGYYKIISLFQLILWRDLTMPKLFRSHFIKMKKQKNDLINFLFTCKYISYWINLEIQNEQENHVTKIELISALLFLKDTNILIIILFRLHRCLCRAFLLPMLLNQQSI